MQKKYFTIVIDSYTRNFENNNIPNNISNNIPNNKYNLSLKNNNNNNFPILSIQNNIVSRSIVDLRNKIHTNYDQGNLNSCTANAICSLIEYNNPNFFGSRLFLYYNERKLENNISNDDGAYLVDGIKSLINYGICKEIEWPYIIKNFAIKPPDKSYASALYKKLITAYNITNNLSIIKNTLSNNIPFVVGIAIYKSFESSIVSTTGNVPMPKYNEKLLGGHAVVCVGYNDIKQIFIMKNSWGSRWGDNGYFYLPYRYLLSSNLSSDLWCIIKMT